MWPCVKNMATVGAKCSEDCFRFIGSLKVSCLLVYAFREISTSQAGEVIPAQLNQNQLYMMGFFGFSTRICC